MSKTIKIIDLLNKIANGEEVPEKIKYEGDILKYEKEVQDYFGVSKTGNGSFFNYLFVNKKTAKFINDTVEIIEEQEDIDIQKITDIKDVFIDNAACGEDVKYLARKYNEILKWAKQLDKKTKEKK